MEDQGLREKVKIDQNLLAGIRLVDKLVQIVILFAFYNIFLTQLKKEQKYNASYT